MSSCDDIADMNEFDERDGESDDDSCDSAYTQNGTIISILC